MTMHRSPHRHDPMRRAQDLYRNRLRACLLLLLVLALATVPFLVGRTAYAAEARTAAAQSATRHQVTARSAADAQGASSGIDVRWAPVRWNDDRGVSHLGFTDVPSDTAKGGRVQVWVDSEDKLVKPPMTRQEALAIGWFAGTLTAVTLLLAFLGTRTAFVAAFDRRRCEKWAAEWQVVEPLWSKRLHT
ncbi:Rv1733c family protein [Streptomyces hesseae]|uniref:Transmembrane protein n=1 Tax=Streptomyces hesseae TaxID=3075519 RepID=A0ABU2SKP5_9ACTN|nr:hypothetical protein [Streptomyces sp. DSM 40473]MDT0449552.1 hypothetical protein [Streptomyces sp. DSM 40473]